MNKNLDKIKLVYEFNNDSPLFARVAEAELNDGKADNALQILTDGLKSYPGYLSAHIVYVEALAKKGEYTKVIDKLEELRSTFNDDEVINYYLEKIEEEKAENQELEDNIRNVDKPIEDDLENLAETISKAKIPRAGEGNVNNEIENVTPTGGLFISETLAEIYLSQSNLKEALEIYEKLLESNPNKAEHYKQKIDEIKNSMNN